MITRDEIYIRHWPHRFPTKFKISISQTYFMFGIRKVGDGTGSIIIVKTYVSAARIYKI